MESADHLLIHDPMSCYEAYLVCLYHVAATGSVLESTLVCLCCIFWGLLIVTLLLGAEWDLYALGGSESYGFLWKEFVK